MKTISILEHDPKTFPYTGFSAIASSRYDHRDALHYTVSGRGLFPDDMLRYDTAGFATPEDEEAARADPASPPREVKIVGKGCTPERWRSFGWTVHSPVIEHNWRHRR